MVFESLYIAQYIDETYGVPNALQPGDALTKYRTRLFVTEAGSVVGDLYGLLMSTEADKEQKAAGARAGIQKWEAAYAAESDGPFFLGETFSLADIAIVPFLDRFRYTLKAYHDFDIFEGAPRMARLMKAASTRPSLTATMQAASLYVDSYKGYAKTSAKSSPLKLYYSTENPIADNARIAVNQKAAKVEAVAIDAGAPPQWYVEKAGPAATTPLLELGDGTLIRDSLLIAQYLDETLETGIKLFSVSSKQKADTRFFLNSLSESTDDYFKAKNGAGEAREAGLKDLAGNLAFLNRVASKAVGAGPFFIGEHPTLADVCSVPLLARYQALYSTIPGAEPFDKAFPRLAQIIEASRKVDGFAQVLPGRT